MWTLTPSTGVLKFFARGCRIVGCNKVCIASFTITQNPIYWGPCPYALRFIPGTLLPTSLKWNPRCRSFCCHSLLSSSQDRRVLLFFTFMELIIDAVIPVKISHLPGKNLAVNIHQSLSDFEAILPEEKQEKFLEMLPHHCPDSLGRLKQIGRFNRMQVSEVLHWPQGTREYMSWYSGFLSMRAKDRSSLRTTTEGLMSCWPNLNAVF